MALPYHEQTSFLIKQSRRYVQQTFSSFVLKIWYFYTSCLLNLVTLHILQYCCFYNINVLEI